MSASRRAPADPDAQLSRELGIRQLAAGIFNYTVGSGIFALPALASAELGPAAPAAYLVCAVLMGLVVLCFAEAGSRVSATGGPYAYVEVALGPLVGFMAGALLWLTDLTGTAAVGALFAASVAALGGDPSGALQRALVVSVFAVLAFVNVRGVRSGARVVEVVTLVKLVPLVGFVLAGAAFASPANLAWPEAPEPGRVLGTAGVLVFAFIGMEAALLPSGEVREPARTVPRAIGLALGAVAALYLAIHVVAQGVLGSALASDRVTPLATAAGSFLGPLGRTTLIVGAALSMLGYLSGAMLAGPRSFFAFGRDGFLPGRLASVHPRYRTPHVAILVYGVLAAALAVSGSFERLAVVTNAAALTLYVLCAVSAWALRRRDVRTDGEPFRVPGGPVVPILTCLAILWVLLETVTRRELAAVAGVLGAALLVYGVRTLRAQPARGALGA